LKIFEKVASSLDGALSLILGEDTKRPADKYIGQYPYLDTY
jgi:hypothetical protein